MLGIIRVSTQGQAKDGYSLKYQEDEIKGYCKEQGWNLIHIFREEGISGAKLNEEALEIDRVGLQEERERSRYNKQQLESIRNVVIKRPRNCP